MYGATLGIEYRALVQQLCPRLLYQAQGAKRAAFGAQDIEPAPVGTICPTLLGRAEVG